MSQKPVLENDFLKVVIDPSMGGRVISFYDKKRQYEQLWYDPDKEPMDPALDYDGNFAGGMDELLPCDIPERNYPDHGELWCLPVTCSSSGNRLTICGELPISQLKYQRTMYLQDNTLISDCRISNLHTAETREFLWKLHAALYIETGDKFFAPCRCVQAADPGDWSKLPDSMPRQWTNPYIIPEFAGGSDFFYLTDQQQGTLELHRGNGSKFVCNFDCRVFPLTWVFISLGRLNHSRTLIMEPCTNYPMSLEDASCHGVCARLSPQTSLCTQIRWSVENID